MSGKIDEGYTREQVRAILKSCNVAIAGETETDFIAYCPFHRNTYTPSFSISHMNGKFICFNPSCENRGNLTYLVGRLTGRNKNEARRFIGKKEGETRQSFEDRLKIQESKKELPEFPQSTIDRMKEDFVSSKEAKNYMKSRGYTKETCDYFEIGFSAKKNMITIPMHDSYGKPIGIIGRGIDKKEFHNGQNLPRNHVLWNTHRAKKIGSIVIITEGSLDAMKVHQAGYPNVVASVGGSFSTLHYKILERYFNKIIIMTDYDEKQYPKNNQECKRCGLKCEGHRPGRDLGMKLVGALPNHDIFWGSIDKYQVYPEGCKDPADMTEEQIKQAIENSVSHLEYSMWLEDGLIT